MKSIKLVCTCQGYIDRNIFNSAQSEFKKDVLLGNIFTRENSPDTIEYFLLKVKYEDSIDLIRKVSHAMMELEYYAVREHGSPCGFYVQKVFDKNEPYKSYASREYDLWGVSEE